MYWLGTRKQKPHLVSLQSSLSALSLRYPERSSRDKQTNKHTPLLPRNELREEKGAGEGVRASSLNTDVV